MRGPSPASSTSALTPLSSAPSSPRSAGPASPSHASSTSTLTPLSSAPNSPRDSGGPTTPNLSPASSSSSRSLPSVPTPAVTPSPARNSASPSCPDSLSGHVSEAFDADVAELASNLGASSLGDSAGEESRGGGDDEDLPDEPGWEVDAWDLVQERMADSLQRVLRQIRRDEIVVGADGVPRLARPGGLAHLIRIACNQQLAFPNLAAFFKEYQEKLLLASDLPANLQ